MIHISNACQYTCVLIFFDFNDKFISNLVVSKPHLKVGGLFIRLLSLCRLLKKIPKDKCDLYQNVFHMGIFEKLRSTKLNVVSESWPNG